eukprot:15229546-Alexandrium_andersonii.AAC.1
MAPALVRWWLLLRGDGQPPPAATWAAPSPASACGRLLGLPQPRAPRRCLRAIDGCEETERGGM